MKWIGVVTNAGNELLTAWVDGKVLQITSADAGSGTVEDVALLAQQAVSSPQLGAGLVGRRKIQNGIQLRIQVAPQEESYSLHQLGVWARIENGEKTLLALYQNREGVPVPSKIESPDFAYTFYGAVVLDNTGKFEVTLDTSVLVSLEMLQEDLLDMRTEIFRTIMTGEVSLPLETSAGEELLTSGGTPIEARYRLERSGSVLDAMVALEDRLTRQISQIAADARDQASAVQQAGQTYTDGQIAAVRQEATTMGTAADSKISAAKQEANAYTDSQLAAHNTAASAHPASLMVVTK